MEILSILVIYKYIRRIREQNTLLLVNRLLWIL